MNIHFSLEYKTQWGEELRLNLTVEHEGGEESHDLPMHTEDGIRWEADFLNERGDIRRLVYQYALYADGQLVWTEWEVAPHVIDIMPECPTMTIDDLWRPIPDELPLFSSAYTECVAPHERQSLNEATPQTLQLRVVEPRLRSDQWLAVTGNTPELGNWSRPVRMRRIGLQEWAVNINAGKMVHTLEYKYVIVDEKGALQTWEEGENRTLETAGIRKGAAWVKTDMTPDFVLTRWKGAGVVIPVFSLRSAKSYGIGDFGDLRRMIEWAHHVGMSAVQILPVNDTIRSHTWEDSYPYNAISVFAYHPIYCDLEQLGELHDRLVMEKFKMHRQQLNGLHQIDYEAVEKCKLDYLWRMFVQEGDEVEQRDDYFDFVMDNKFWLMPYAAFCCLRDLHHTADSSEWGDFATFYPDLPDTLAAMGDEQARTIRFHLYVQYQLHLQLSLVHELAKERGIIIKGDIPIGISRDSVEAWTSPELFNLDMQAGAPPDAFSTNGQNWGFPTYRWERMADDGYEWWTRRFTKMADYFDAYRIDHVLGFFRIWEIPAHAVHGLLGQFNPALPLSANDMARAGLLFDEDWMTRPFITDESLQAIFPGKDEYVRVFFLNLRADGRYDLKPEYATQQLIRQAFEGKDSDTDRFLRDGLYALASDVLFVRDHKNPSLFHPRISAQFTFAYQSLDQQQKDVFNRLYDEFFYRRHNRFWYDEAMRKLPHLTQATRMLVCAEDLGMVPDCVPWVMDRLRMLSLEIQTMSKDNSREFALLEQYPYRSVDTISTHDMPPMRLWWEEDHERAQRFYNDAMRIDGTAPHDMPAWLCQEVISHHLYSPSMLCLFSWQDWMSMDEKLRLPSPGEERVNVPANPRHYWRYRMHINMEKLMKEETLNNKIRDMIHHSGRG